MGLLLFAIADQRVGLLPSWRILVVVDGGALALVASVLGFELVPGLAAMINAAALIGLGMALRRAFAAPVQGPGFSE
jgi:hypothetical protein